MSAIIVPPSKILDIPKSGDYGKRIGSAKYDTINTPRTKTIDISFTTNLDFTPPADTASSYKAVFEMNNNATVIDAQQRSIGGTYRWYILFYTDISASLPIVNSVYGKVKDSIYGDETIFSARLPYQNEDYRIFVVNDESEFIWWFTNTYPSATYTFTGHEIFFALQAVDDNTVRLYECVPTYAYTGVSEKRTSLEISMEVGNSSGVAYYPAGKGNPVYEMSPTNVGKCALKNSTDYETLVAQSIVQQYNDGIETAEIRCAISNYSDENGNVVISTTDTIKPFVFQIGDVVIPYRQTVDGAVPLSIDIDGNARKFYVYGVQFPYDGGISQSLLLRTYKTE